MLALAVAVATHLVPTSPGVWQSITPLCRTDLFHHHRQQQQQQQPPLKKRA